MLAGSAQFRHGDPASASAAVTSGRWRACRCGRSPRYGYFPITSADRAQNCFHLSPFYAARSGLITSQTLSGGLFSVNPLDPKEPVNESRSIPHCSAIFWAASTDATESGRAAARAGCLAGTAPVWAAGGWEGAGMVVLLVSGGNRASFAALGGNRTSFMAVGMVAPRRVKAQPNRAMPDVLSVVSLPATISSDSILAATCASIDRRVILSFSAQSSFVVIIGAGTIGDTGAGLDSIVFL